MNGVGTARVSIGMPVYNGADYVRTAIESILTQDFRSFELIISDNASTDETAAICREYAAADKRIRYYRNDKNLGAGPNMRRVVELARCDLFAWAMHDHVHLPGFLRRCIEVMDEAPPTVVLVAPGAEIIDAKGDGIKEDWKVERLDIRSHRPSVRAADVIRNVAWATAQFGVYRTEKLRRTRLIGSFPFSDHVLLLEVALLGEIWQIPDVLFQRRYHPGVSDLTNKTQAEFLEWFDTSNKPTRRRRFWRFRHHLQPRWQLMREFLRSVCTIPVSPVERMLSLAYVSAIWFSRERRRLTREYGFRLRDHVVRLLSNAEASR